MKITCDFCGAKITKPAALLFGPPDDASRCRKDHVCLACYRWIEDQWEFLIKRKKRSK